MSIISLLFGWTKLPQLGMELVALAAVASLAAGGLALYNHHERVIGATQCVNAVKESNSKQDAHNAAVQASDAATVHQEGQDYAKARSAPVTDPVRVYLVAPRVPDVQEPAAPAAPGPGADAAPDNGGADHGGPVPPQSFGPELQAIGKDADAQIRGLQDYINRVCRAK